MAYTYAWSNAIDWLRAYSRNIPVDKISAQMCDNVSSEMWAAYPWRDACTTIPPFALVDDVQDYSVPPNIFKLVSAQIVKLTPAPESALDPLTVVDGLPFNNTKVEPSLIKEISMERGEGLLRLSYRAGVYATNTYELRGSYQMQHNRVQDASEETWFKDQLWHVAMEGILYEGYKLGDRPAQAAAQYTLFRNKLREAWMQESSSQAAQIAPAEGSIGVPLNMGW